MRFSVVQGPPGRRRRGWRHGVALAALLVAASAQAQWVIPAGAGVDMVGGSTDLACTDLIVEGPLRVGPGGTILGVRNVVIAATGSLDLAGGTIQLSQQWTALGLFTAGGGRVIRIDGGAACPAAGPLGPLDFSPKPVPVTSPGMLAALALLLAGTVWCLNRRRLGLRTSNQLSNSPSDRSAP